jgi:hypothetical protein
MGELDFVVENRQGQVIPIEIKSGKDYKRHRALSNVLKTPNYSIDNAYVFCEDNLSTVAGPEGTGATVAYCPIYMIGCLER